MAFPGFPFPRGTGSGKRLLRLRQLRFPCKNGDGRLENPGRGVYIASCLFTVGNIQGMEMSKPKIVVCLGSSCFARGNEENIRVVEDYLQKNSYQDDVDVELSGTLCQGRCSEGPNVIVDGKMYNKVDPGVMLDILKRTLPPRS